jgi:hypothetical protein
MHNRILRVAIDPVRLSPVESVLRVVVEPERRTPTTEVRGRLVGPRCRFAATVEVAHAIRPTRDEYDCAGRVVIPEASFWDPESPFLYEGYVELWEEGRCVDRAVVTHGLRLMSLGTRGLRVNGRPFRLRGRRVAQCGEAEALEMRRQGLNLWLVPASADTTHLCELADRIASSCSHMRAGDVSPPVVRKTGGLTSPARPKGMATLRDTPVISVG